MSDGVEQFVRLFSADWPENRQLKVKPGDLAQFAHTPHLASWLEPPSIARPFSYAPCTEAAGGTIYFDRRCKAEDLESALRLMGVNLGNRAYAVFSKEAYEPAKDRYLTQLRIVSKYALRWKYGALSDEEKEDFPDQDLTTGELICRFVEFQKEKYGGRAPGLAGVMGGNGDSSIERLAFGFMVEDSRYGIVRIWARPWLVCK